MTFRGSFSSSINLSIRLYKMSHSRRQSFSCPLLLESSPGEKQQVQNTCTVPSKGLAILVKHSKIWIKMLAADKWKHLTVYASYELNKHLLCYYITYTHIHSVRKSAHMHTQSLMKSIFGNPKESSKMHLLPSLCLSTQTLQLEKKINRYFIKFCGVFIKIGQ